MEVFPHTKKFSMTPVGWHFNSVLTLSTWRWCQILQVKSSIPQDVPPPTLQMQTAKSRSPGHSPLLSNLASNLRFLQLLLVFFFFKDIFIYFILVLLGLSCGTQDLPCIMQDFSLRCTDTLVVAWDLELADSVVTVHGLSCSATCEILVPWPRNEPESSALQGEFFTTGPPGKFPLDFDWFARMAHRTQGKVYQFIKGYDKGYKRTVRWRDTKGKGCGNGPGAPRPLPASPCVHQLGSSLNPVHLGFYGDITTEARSITNSIFIPSPFSREWRGRGRSENTKLLIKTQFLGKPGLIHKTPRSWITISLLKQKALLSPKRLQGFQELSARNWGRGQGGEWAETIFSTISH